MTQAHECAQPEPIRQKSYSTSLQHKAIKFISINQFLDKKFNDKVEGPNTIKGLPPSLAVSTAENGNMHVSITENVIRDISDADTRANHAHD